MDYSLDSFATKVLEFNTIAGKNTVPTKQDLLNQMKIIMEEVKETINDLEANDRVGVLDGYTDMMVTVVGFGQMLNNLNIPTNAALHETADNNLTKFPRINDNLTVLYANTARKYPQHKVGCTVYEDRAVFKNENNKVLKPEGYIPNDLSLHVPDTWMLV